MVANVSTLKEISNKINQEVLNIVNDFLRLRISIVNNKKYTGKKLYTNIVIS